MSVWAMSDWAMHPPLQALGRAQCRFTRRVISSRTDRYWELPVKRASSLYFPGF